MKYVGANYIANTNTSNMITIVINKKSNQSKEGFFLKLFSISFFMASRDGIYSIKKGAHA
jgi:hypothetical protein